MKIEPTELPGILVLTPVRHTDDRGWFTETWNRERLAETGIDLEFVQDNHSFSSRRGSVRGLHFQAPPRAQAKLVRVARGSAWDVAVDIRVGSPTFGWHVAVVLNASEGNQLLVPAGFAHGFCTLEPDTEVLYKVTDTYAPDCDLGILWNDPDLGIAWPVGEDEAVLSDRDRRHPRLRDLPECFLYEESEDGS